MTDVTPRTTVETAIDAWAAENTPGGVVSGYALIVAVDTAEDAEHRTFYQYAVPDSQAMHTSLGLANMLSAYVDVLARRGMSEEGE